MQVVDIGIHGICLHCARLSTIVPVLNTDNTNKSIIYTLKTQQ